MIGAPHIILHTASARDVLNALRATGAADVQPKAGPPAAPTLCARGHDKSVTGIYRHQNVSRGYRYREDRCRMCRIEDVRKSKGSVSREAWWGEHL